MPTLDADGRTILGVAFNNAHYIIFVVETEGVDRYYSVQNVRTQVEEECGPSLPDAITWAEAANQFLHEVEDLEPEETDDGAGTGTVH